eukprot:s2111_g11.t1
MFVELSGSSSSGARGVHALEGADNAEEWWGYDQEGYDNSEYAQEEDPDDEWEWDEDAQMWISATVARGKASPKSNVKCHLCGRRGHMAKQCKADMSKVKCFRCSKFGHIGAQCPEKQKNPGNNQQKKPQAKAGKGKGKGKMHELTEQDSQEAATGSGDVLMPLISSVEPSDDEWKWWLIDSGEQKFFQAKSLKLVFPIVYPLELVGRFVHATEAGPAPAVRDQETVEIIPEDFARLPDNLQPPRHWIDAHGRTEGCSSCATRSGRHSKKCVERYHAWLRARRNQGDQPDQQLPQPAVEPNREEDVAVAVPSVPKPGTSPGLMRIPGLPLGMEPTRHCPSCESGMVAPGVRHSAECRRKQAEFRDLEQQIVAPPEGELEDAPYSPSLGPEEPANEPADVNMEELPEASSAPAEAAPSAVAEQSAPEVAQEDVAMDFEATDHRLPMDISMIDVCQCSEQIRIGCLTSPDLLFQERLSVESISFSGVQHSFEEVVLCGERVKLWKPTGAVSDTTLEELDPQGTFLAMVKELKGLTQAGRYFVTDSFH